MVQQPSYWKVFTRRKRLTADGSEVDTKLNRVLGLWDLTALGVGSTLGAGVYVLAGQIAKEQAGPSVMLSFAIAALASLLAGVCYAEFGARVPKAGSAYIYSYVCIGEFAAFVIGWNLILEYVIGTAAVCRGISLYLDSMLNDTLKSTFAEVAPMNVAFLGSYFDFLAFGLVIVFGVALAFGVETSALLNNFCTCLNISVLIFVVIAGAIKADVANWTVDAASVNATDIGTGGFFPYGFAGTLKGAATCFFGFVGFDCIATTGEEVRNPRKNIPRSILISLLIIFLCYFGVSTVLTLMVPYYMQDVNAPLPSAFETVGWPAAMWIVSIGGLIGLLASLFGALFPLPRVMYSMAQDGLLFRFLGKVSPRFRVPVNGSICAALLTALIAGIFDLAQLVSLLSIGTLLAYSVVAISVTILRYMDNAEDLMQQQPQQPMENGNQSLTELSMLTSSGSRVTFKAVMAQLFNVRRLHTPNKVSTRIVGTMITLFCLLALGIGLLVMQAYEAIMADETWALVLLGLLLLFTLLVLVAICLQPRENYTRLFRVPLVPIVPALSIFINIYLMLQLDELTWIRFGIWMIIGLPIFIACWCMYDIKNPVKRNPERVTFLRELRKGEEAESDKDIVLDVEKSNKAYASAAKSLDEIRNINDGSEDLIEVKHANGKLFYIEDTKSNTSTVTLGKDENDADSKSLEDEKSVIAFLDDVLQAEDDGISSPLPRIHGFSRNYSVDSEMYPSVIETTIVVTVHSSSSDSSGGGLEDVPELEMENVSSLRDSLARYQESKIAAEQMLAELFASAELWHRLEAQRQFKESENVPIRLKPVESLDSLLSNASAITDPLHSEPFKNKLSENVLKPHLPIPRTAGPITPNASHDRDQLKTSELRPSQSEPDLGLLAELRHHLEAQRQPKESQSAPSRLKRVESEDSLLSSASAFSDPLHSEQFKNKLSEIIMKPHVPTPKTAKSMTPIAFEAGDQLKTPELQPSQREPDLGLLVERVTVQLSEPSGHLDEHTQGIPKPPKFDPVLYETINGLSLKKQRPALSAVAPGVVAMPSAGEQTKVAPQPAEETSPELPFKSKLEAILKSGPSHPTQQRPEVHLRRPRSEYLTNAAEGAEGVASAFDRVRKQAKSEGNLVAELAAQDSIAAAAEILSNARKSLRPVLLHTDGTP